MYCIITTCSVEGYWHCSDETVHYKYNETINFCCFRCATTSPITVFYELCFLHLFLLSKTLERLRIDQNLCQGSLTLGVKDVECLHCILRQNSFARQAVLAVTPLTEQTRIIHCNKMVPHCGKIEQSAVALSVFTITFSHDQSSFWTQRRHAKTFSL